MKNINWYRLNLIYLDRFDIIPFDWNRNKAKQMRFRNITDSKKFRIHKRTSKK